MAEQQERPAFNFSSMDWDAYVKHRPIYPEELYSKIFAYHDSHGGGYESAVDVGAGVGIVSQELVKKGFKHVTVTDPSEAYVESARAHFAGAPQGTMSFLATKAEDLSLDKLPKGEKVDLITAAECLHWADVDTAAPKIASVLKSGGTFAAWLYGVRPLLSEQDASLAEARSIFYEIYDKMIRQYETQIEPQTEDSGGAAMNARLNHMLLSSDPWTDVRRIHTRAEEAMAHAGWPSRASKVAAGEKVEKFGNEDLLFQLADYEYLEGYLVNWIPPVKVKEFAKTELERLKAAMGGKKIGAVWPFVLVLATRK